MDDTFNQGKELAYDVRETIANILSEILMQITASRIERRYSDWLSLLDDFHTEISMKLNTKDEEQFKKIWNETLEHVNKYPMVLNGASSDPLYHAEVHGKIKELEMWLKKTADKKKVFGSKKGVEGLS